MWILSTREWATVIWFLILFIYIMLHRKIRESFFQVLKIFFGKKLRVLWGIILFYVIGITLLVCQLPFWKYIYFKDVLIWFVFSGLIHCMNAVTKEADEDYIRKNIKENLKLTIILEFIISTFTFNIWIELAIIPVVGMILVMNFIAKLTEDYKKAHKLLEVVLTVIGFWILYGTIKIAIYEYKELDILDTFVSFMIPIVYLFLTIPLEYVLELYSKYEIVFIQMLFREEKDRKIKRRHRWLLLKICRFSVRKVLTFQKKYLNKMYSRMSEVEFEKMMNDFKFECKKGR